MNKFEAKELNQIANRLFREYYEGCKGDPMNCGSCAIVNDSEYGGPNYAGWGRIYVEAEKPIPEKWRDAFYDELTSDNEAYRAKLEESVRWFGVRWSR